jgi:hypothetical protein
MARCVGMEASSRGPRRRSNLENVGALRAPGLLRFARNDAAGSTQMQLALEGRPLVDELEVCGGAAGPEGVMGRLRDASAAQIRQHRRRRGQYRCIMSHSAALGGVGRPKDAVAPRPGNAERSRQPSPG